jgi:hypothetical protein
MAEATALFNSGPRDPGTEPDTPFQILYVPSDGNTTFTVQPGTTIYVPVIWADNSSPVIGDFPDVTDRTAVANYYFSQEELGAEVLEIDVDGTATSLLEEDYPVGAATSTSTGGTAYTVVAAFLTPLPKGTHQVTIRAYFDGAALAPYGGIYAFEVTYTVNVK